MRKKLFSFFHCPPSSDPAHLQHLLSVENARRAIVSLVVCGFLSCTMMLYQISTLRDGPLTSPANICAFILIRYSIILLLVEGLLAVLLGRSFMKNASDRYRTIISMLICAVNMQWGTATGTMLYWLNGNFQMAYFQVFLFFHCLLFLLKPPVGVPMVMGSWLLMLALVQFIQPQRSIPPIDPQGFIELLEITGFIVVIAMMLLVVMYRTFARNTENILTIQRLNARLSQQIDTDSLTGVFSRKAFMEQLQSIFENAGEKNGTLSVAICDIDYFKQYNDTYGHIQGDICLLEVAKCLQSTFEHIENAMVARYGGEEFGIFFSNHDPEEAAALCQKAVDAIQSLQIPHTGSDIQPVVTISVGLYTFSPAQEKADLGSALTIADNRLYDAKRNGRNQIVSCFKAA